MRSTQKILIEQNSGQKFYVKSVDDNFHTSFGTIDRKDLQFNKHLVKSNKNQTFWLLEPSFIDLLENLKRGPQTVNAKDIGWIIAKTGINKNSKIVDAGGGSGALCFSLANICKQITVYENNPEHYDILVKNQQMFGLGNITLKQEDVYKGIKEENLDLITLDLPEPWKVTSHAEKALVEGGFIVVYLPNLNQVKMFLDSTKKTSIKILETVELLERKWKIEDKIMRPEFEMLGHTGFLVLGRKLG